MLAYCWSNFQIGFAVVASILLLMFIDQVPLCSLGMPFPPTFRGSAIYNWEPGDIQISINPYGNLIVDDKWYRVGEAFTVPRPAAGRFVIIAADRHLKYGVVCEAIRAARNAGISRVVLTTTLPPPAVRPSNRP